MPGKLFAPMLVGHPPAECRPPVRGGGWHSFTTAIHSGLRRGRCWHIIFQLDREATWVVDGGQPLALRAGRIALIPPGHAFQGGDAVDQPNVHAWLELDPAPAAKAGLLDPADHARLYALLPAAPTVRPMDDDLRTALRTWCQALAAGPGPWHATRRRAAVLAVLAGLGTSLAAPPAADDDHATAPAITLAESRLRAGEAVTVGELAARCRLEPTAFTRRFRAAHGRPPGDWLGWRRTSLAVDRLRRGRESVTTVAMALGFPSSQHFAVCCRRYFGGTPQALRQERPRNARRDAGITRRPT